MIMTITELLKQFKSRERTGLTFFFGDNATTETKGFLHDYIADSSVIDNAMIKAYGHLSYVFADDDKEEVYQEFVNDMKCAYTVYKFDIAQIDKALRGEYNPLHNFDRNEEIDEKNWYGKTVTKTDSTNDTQTSYGTTFDSATEQESGKLASYTDGRKVTTNGHGEKHKANNHLYGNIGTTKSQEMARDEVELRGEMNFWKSVFNLLLQDITMYIDKGVDVF